RRLYGGGRRAVARPRRGRDGLARARAGERDGLIAFGLSRRDTGRDAGWPGRAQGFRPAGVAGPRALDLDRLARMLAHAERPLVLVGGALLADAVHDKAVLAALNRFSEEWVLPINPTHRRPQ